MRIPAALAVDFFFMLSGFVLAYAYGAKLDQGMSWSRYMTARIVRLYPMLLFGIALGGMVALARPAPHDNFATFAATLFVLPAGLLWANEGQTVFLFNGLIWSLFFEFVASAVYGSRLRNSRWLLPGFIVCCIALIAAGIWAGSVADLGRRGIVGVLAGFPRVAVPFAIGAALYRWSAFERFPKLPFAVPAAVLAALLLMPIAPQWRYELPCIFIAFPLLICIGAQANDSRLCQPLGDLSYPLYLVHWPLTVVIASILRTHIASKPLGIAISMAACALFAWTALVLYDEPVRRWLRRQRPIIGGFDLNNIACVRAGGQAIEDDRATSP